MLLKRELWNAVVLSVQSWLPGLLLVRFSVYNTENKKRPLQTRFFICFQNFSDKRLNCSYVIKRKDGELFWRKQIVKSLPVFSEEIAPQQSHW